MTDKPDTAVTSDNPRSSSPPPPRPDIKQSPVCELDQLRNKYMGLKLITTGRVSIATDGIENVDWVLANNLPTHSNSATHPWYPHQLKKLSYTTNQQQIITWIEYA